MVYCSNRQIYTVRAPTQDTFNGVWGISPSATHKTHSFTMFTIQLTQLYVHLMATTLAHLKTRVHQPGSGWQGELMHAGSLLVGWIAPRDGTVFIHRVWFYSPRTAGPPLICESYHAWATKADHKQFRIGWLGYSKGFYLHCQLDGNSCQALVDMGSTISIVRPGVLAYTLGPLPPGWATGERAEMREHKPLCIGVGDRQTHHDFWLGNIRDPCIIGLDLLAYLGAWLDISRSAIHLGKTSVVLLQPVAPHNRLVAWPSRKGLSKGRKRMGVFQGHIPSAPPPPLSTMPAWDLCQHSSEGLDDWQQQIRILLNEFVNIFMARDQKCTQTGLVQHDIIIGTAAPIRLCPHQLVLVKQEVAEQKSRK